MKMVEDIDFRDPSVIAEIICDLEELAVEEKEAMQHHHPVIAGTIVWLRNLIDSRGLTTALKLIAIVCGEKEKEALPIDQTVAASWRDALEAIAASVDAIEGTSLSALRLIR